MIQQNDDTKTFQKKSQHWGKYGISRKRVFKKITVVFNRKKIRSTKKCYVYFTYVATYFLRQDTCSLMYIKNKNNNN